MLRVAQRVHRVPPRAGEPLPERFGTRSLQGRPWGTAPDLWWLNTALSDTPMGIPAPGAHRLPTLTAGTSSRMH